MPRAPGRIQRRLRATGCARGTALALVWALVLAAPLATAHAQHVNAAESGETLYRAACRNCHGADGRGAEPAAVGFSDPLPDFTDCSFASREAAQDWYAVVHQGGPVRAFSRRMPAFGRALTGEQIERVVAHVMSFCRDRAWPRGELNLPRAIATEKAFPEDESVLEAGAVTTRGERAIGSTLIYERRIGARSQWELVVPVGVRERPGAPGRWTGIQLGDVALALKHTLTHSAERGHIVSAGVEGILPTGSVADGFGAGTFIAEPFVLAAKLLPGNAFIQTHLGAEVPANERKAEREIFGRVAIGATFGSEFGRAFSPMVEFLAKREMEGGAATSTEWIPQIQVSLSKRQHILANIGVRLPITDRTTRPRELVAYVLWDWFDGGLFDGWR